MGIVPQSHPLVRSDVTAVQVTESNAFVHFHTIHHGPGQSLT